MGKTGYIMLGIALVALFAVIGIYLYQKTKNDAELVNQQKLLALQQGLHNTQTQGGQLGGIFGFLGGLANSQTGQSLVPVLTKSLIV